MREKIKSFLESAKVSGKGICVPTKTTVLGVFGFRAFLNMTMLLSESDKARALRQLTLKFKGGFLVLMLFFMQAFDIMAKNINKRI